MVTPKESGSAEGGVRNEPFRITHLRGPMTRQVREMALAQGGEALWEELLSRVSEPCRARFSPVPGYFEWVDAHLSRELSLAWATLRSEAVSADRGAMAVDVILRATHRWLLSLATPQMLIQTFPKLMGLYYRGPKAQVDFYGPGRAELSLYASGAYEEWYARYLPSFLRLALSQAVGGPVDVTYTAPRDSEGDEAYRHQYLALWHAD